MQYILPRTCEDPLIILIQLGRIPVPCSKLLKIRANLLIHRDKDRLWYDMQNRRFAHGRNRYGQVCVCVLKLHGTRCQRSCSSVTEELCYKPYLTLLSEDSSRTGPPRGCVGENRMGFNSANLKKLVHRVQPRISISKANHYHAWLSHSIRYLHTARQMLYSCETPLLKPLAVTPSHPHHDVGHA